MSKEIMKTFYESFQKHDATAMASLYHPDAKFSDPAFANLNQREVGGMWKMLIERSGGELEIEFHSLIGDHEVAQCTWEAKYKFSKTKREVHNIIHATMKFKDGFIVHHIDDFNFWRWSRMALGLSGTLLGWTPLLRKKVQKMAMSSLQNYLNR